MSSAPDMQGAVQLVNRYLQAANIDLSGHTSKLPWVGLNAGESKIRRGRPGLMGARYIATCIPGHGHFYSDKRVS